MRNYNTDIGIRPDLHRFISPLLIKGRRKRKKSLCAEDIVEKLMIPRRPNKRILSMKALFDAMIRNLQQHEKKVLGREGTLSGVGVIPRNIPKAEIRANNIIHISCVNPNDFYSDTTEFQVTSDNILLSRYNPVTGPWKDLVSIDGILTMRNFKKGLVGYKKAWVRNMSKPSYISMHRGIKGVEREVAPPSPYIASKEMES